MTSIDCGQTRWIIVIVYLFHLLCISNAHQECRGHNGGGLANSYFTLSGHFRQRYQATGAMYLGRQAPFSTREIFMWLCSALLSWALCFTHPHLPLAPKDFTQSLGNRRAPPQEVNEALYCPLLQAARTSSRELPEGRLWRMIPCFPANLCCFEQ